MTHLRLLTLGLIALSLAGCGTGTPLPLTRTAQVRARAVASDASLYPLALGWTWRYQSRTRTDNGPSQPGADQLFKIVQFTDASGSVRAVMERWYGARQFPSTLCVRDESGVVLSRADHPEQGSITVLRFPLTAGESWPGRTWPQATETIACAGTESLQVPAGTFVATRLDHHIRYPNGTEDQLHYWYAPGVGMVKAIEGLTVDLGQGPHLQQVTCELSEYGPRP